MSNIDWKTYLARLKNPGVIVGIVGYVVVILINMGIEVDNTAVMNIVNAVCSVLVLLGVMNTSDTSGVDLPVVIRRERVVADRDGVHLEDTDLVGNRITKAPTPPQE